MFIKGFEPMMVAWPPDIRASNPSVLTSPDTMDQVLDALVSMVKFPVLQFTAQQPKTVHALIIAQKRSDLFKQEYFGTPAPARPCTSPVRSRINDMTLDWPMRMFDRRALVVHLTPYCLLFGVDLRKCYWQIAISEHFQSKCGHFLPPAITKLLLPRLQALFPVKFANYTPEMLTWSTLSRLSFGFKSGAVLASLLVGELIKCIKVKATESHGTLRHHLLKIFGYIDDLLGIVHAEDIGIAAADYKVTHSTAKDLGVGLHLKNEKDEAPFTDDGKPRYVKEWCGNVYDTARQTVGVSQLKQQQTVFAITAAVKPGATKGQVLSLLSLLESLVPVVRGAGAYIQPLWSALYRGGPPTSGMDKRRFQASPAATTCLEKWAEILLTPAFKWHSSWAVVYNYRTKCFMTDAAGTISKNYCSFGWALLIGNQVVRGVFGHDSFFAPDSIYFDPHMTPKSKDQDEDMTWKELYPYVWVLEKLGELLTNSILMGIEDNLATMFANNNFRSHSLHVQYFLFRMSDAMRLHNVDMLLDWQYRKFLHTIDFWTRAY